MQGDIDMYLLFICFSLRWLFISLTLILLLFSSSQLLDTDHALPRPTSSDASFGFSRMPETTTFLVDSHTVRRKKELKPPLLVMILAVQSLENMQLTDPWVLDE
jgi:hypothetical protein